MMRHASATDRELQVALDGALRPLRRTGSDEERAASRPPHAVVLADGSETMAIWRATVADFVDAIEAQQVFRTVRSRTFDGHDDASVPADDVVFVLTDGWAGYWRDGTAPKVLADRIRSGAVVVVHLLPFDRWRNTGITTHDVRFRARASRRAGLDWQVPTVGSAMLDLTDVSGDAVAVPVVECDGRHLSRWAAALAGTVEWTSLPAILVDPGQSAVNGPTVDDRPVPVRLSQWVSDVRASLSPVAAELAVRLAAAPLTLGTLHAVARSMPRATTTDLAEVLTSGLVRPIPVGADTGPDGIAFEFVTGVREELLVFGRRDRTMATLRTVERTLPDVDAVRGIYDRIAGRPDAHRPTVTPQALPFLTIEFTVARAVSGQALTRARELARQLGTRDALPAAPAPTAQPTAAGPGYVARPTIVGNLPSRNPDFIGRADLLAMLDDRPAGRDPTVPIVVVHGMAGAGKSQLVLEYVHRRLGDHDLIWWIPAQKRSAVVAAFVEMAHRLGLPGAGDAAAAPPAVRDRLRTAGPDGNWLLVFDDADDPAEIGDHVPVGGAGRILVTTRHPRGIAATGLIEVGVPTRADSVALLARRLPDIAPDAAARLADRLGDLPLAVDQIGAWLAETGMPAEELLQLDDTDLLTVLLDEEQRPPGYPVPAGVAWNRSLDAVRSRDPVAYRLLRHCADLPPGPVTLTELSTADPQVGDRLALLRAVRTLARSGLARVDRRTGSIDVHRLVRLVVRGLPEQQ